MKRWKTRSLSLLLTASMMLSMIPPAIAADEDGAGTSYFDFDGSEYEVQEGGEITIKIVRQGDGDAEANVAVKAADFLSTYGVDYVITDASGRELHRVSGEKPDYSQFTYTEEEEESEETADDSEEEDSAADPDDSEEADPSTDPDDSEEEDSAADPDGSEEANPAAEPNGSEEEDPSADPDSSEEDDPSADPEPEEKAVSAKAEETRAADPEESSAVLDKVTGGGDTAQASVSHQTGSSLLNAAYDYLRLPSGEEEETIETVVEDTLTEIYKYFEKAEGAEGIIHFDRGETEKTLTLKALDNNTSDGSRILMLALLGTDNDAVTIAPNATTYVNIVDDEDYQAPSYELDADGIVLSEGSPTARATIRRTSGTQYFSFAYLSTVRETAPDGSYASMADKPVAFVPGETEKTVTLRAADFSASGTFGLRLDDEDGRHSGYASIEIRGNGKTPASAEEGPTLSDEPQAPEHAMPETAEPSDSAAPAPEEPADGTDDVSLLAEGRYLGARITDPGGRRSNSKIDSYGSADLWANLATGGSRFSYGVNQFGKLLVQNDTKGHYSIFYTTKKFHFTGIYNMRFSLHVQGQGSYHTRVETDIDQSFVGHYGVQGWYLGKHPWKEEDLDVSNLNMDLYLKFAVHVDDEKSFPQALLDWINFYWTKFDLSPQSSLETLRQNLYDFSTGTMTVRHVYEGGSEKEYTPGKVQITDSKGNAISGFYGNANENIYFTADQETINKGYRLKGVYLVSGDTKPEDLYNAATNTYNSGAGLFLEADANGRVEYYADQSALGGLIYKKVIPSKSRENETIKVYPVYTPDNVQVKFLKWDKSDSRFANVAETWAAQGSARTAQTAVGKLWKSGSNYYMMVPGNSVIRVRVSPTADRVAMGTQWRYANQRSYQRTYYEEGGTKFAVSRFDSTTIQQNDYTLADLVAEQDLILYPFVILQNFWVQYSPSYYNADKGEIFDTLKDAVVAGEITDPSAQRSNESGVISMNGVSLGSPVVVNAVPPDGYYTRWGNLTGDTNHDGVIDTKDDPQLHLQLATTNMPPDVYGNTLSLLLDSDYTQYHYVFLPKLYSNNAKRLKSGKVVRTKNTLFRLAKGLDDLGETPVAGASVNVAGMDAVTDLNGEFSVDLSAISTAWGSISMRVSADGQNYYTTGSVFNNMEKTIIPALNSALKAKSLSATYETIRRDQSSSLITVENETLTITADILAQTAIKPKGARFFIYNSAGMVKKELTGADGYQTTFNNMGSNVYRAVLRFNPTMDIDNGDTIHVEFQDPNGNWYPEIDVGYSFIKRLQLTEFSLPMIGSSGIADATELIINNNIVQDIIGVPLADMDVGDLEGLNNESYLYAPAAWLRGATSVEDLPEEQRWVRSDYSAGWVIDLEDLLDQGDDDDEEGDDEGIASNTQAGEEMLKKYLSAVADGKTDGVPTDASNFATQSKFNFNLTPEVGFKMTLSHRKDARNNTTYNYFEDLVFYLRVEGAVGGSGLIQTPIGISVAVGVNLDGDVVGIYHMYNAYPDDDDESEAVRYDPENFGLFKKFNNGIRREGYIFLNPTIAANLGLSVVIVEIGGQATFAFDMDFRFTEEDIYTYGMVNVKLKWYIKVIGFQVYSKNLLNGDKGVDVEMFHSRNQDGPIDFDYAVKTALQEASSLPDADGEGYSIDTPASRAYLKNRSAWNSGVSLMSGASDGTTEQTLLAGTAENPQVSIVKLNGDRMLMVFIGDDASRSDIHKRALYYSIYDGSAWGEPQLVDDDGTLDDFPNVFEIDDSRILVSWSSAEDTLPEGANLEQALRSLNLKAAFFDKNTERFGKVTQLTKTTDRDYAADVMPRAAYDSGTGKLILYYTKTQYDNLARGMEALGEAESVIAYLFYDDTNGWQNNGGCYTAEDLKGMADPEEYKEQWYGQRFLDPRTDPSAEQLPRLVDTTAISYNHLALFAWTVDWDNDLDTTDDRDVFMQIYNFNEQKFTHLIRVTESRGTYAAPQFARSNNATYLFYGAQDAGEDGVTNEIRYINVSAVISGEQYTQSGSNYYDLKYTRNYEPFLDADGSTIQFESETHWVNVDTAAECGNISNYTVYVSEEDQMYLFWTDGKADSREIMASLFYGDGGAESADSGVPDDGWSEPFQLTERAGGYYIGIGACVDADGRIYLVSGRGSLTDESEMDLAFLTHTPFASVELEGVTIDEAYPTPGGVVPVTATLRNPGMRTWNGSRTVEFSNGSETVSGTYDGDILGGGTVSVTVYMAVPEGFGTFAVSATMDGVSKSDSREAGLVLEFVNEEISAYDTYDSEQQFTHVYTASVTNSGSAESGELTVTATPEGGEPFTVTAPSIYPGETAEITLPFVVDDSRYTVEGAVGTAKVAITLSGNGKTLRTREGSAKKKYDEEAVALLEGASVAKGASFTLDVDRTDYFQPDIAGAYANDLMVVWLESSDSGIAYIDSANAVTGLKNGEVTLTGILVPKSGAYLLGADGDSLEIPWEDRIPADRIQTVTATLTVGGGTEPTPGKKPQIDAGEEEEADETSAERPERGEAYRPTAASRIDNSGAGAKTSEPTSEQTTQQPDTTAQTGQGAGNAAAFQDVAQGAYYFDAVNWAVANGVTAGTSPNAFSPERVCTRAQVVTFLWRAAGSPAPSTTSSAFTDVQPGAYYEQAMLWAVENGITAGTTATTFGPELPCTRAQVVTFLYRTANTPETAAAGTFDDVAEDAYYAAAVHWAVAQGVTSGTGPNRFSPDDPCQRGQTVSFLYRYFTR